MNTTASQTRLSAGTSEYAAFLNDDFDEAQGRSLLQEVAFSSEAGRRRSGRIFGFTQQRQISEISLCLHHPFLRFPASGFSAQLRPPLDSAPGYVEKQTTLALWYRRLLYL